MRVQFVVEWSHTHTRTHAALRVWSTLRVWSIQICKYWSNEWILAFNVRWSVNTLLLTIILSIQVNALKSPFVCLFIPCIICTKHFEVNEQFGIWFLLSCLSKQANYGTNIPIREFVFSFSVLEIGNLIIENKWKNGRYVVSKLLIHLLKSICVIVYIWFFSLLGSVGALNLRTNNIKGRRQIWH